MSIERDAIIISELERTLQKGDIQACYELLASIRDGVIFRVSSLLFQLAPSLPEEKELMQRSVVEKRELGLVKTTERIIIIEGFGGGIDLDEIAGAIYEIVEPEKSAVFSHTHWDVGVHPIPAFAAVGFGDIPLFEMFIGQYPLLECRAAFNNENNVRSIIYKGKIERMGLNSSSDSKIALPKTSGD